MALLSNIAVQFSRMSGYLPSPPLGSSPVLRVLLLRTLLSS